jgi:hypothetical protein
VLFTLFFSTYLCYFLLYTLTSLDPRWAHPQSFDFMYFIRYKFLLFLSSCSFFDLPAVCWLTCVPGWNPTMAGWTFNRRQNGLPCYLLPLHRKSIYYIPCQIWWRAVSAGIVCSLFSISSWSCLLSPRPFLHGPFTQLFCDDDQKKDWRTLSYVLSSVHLPFSLPQLFTLTCIIFENNNQ